MTQVTLGYAGPYPRIPLPVNRGFFRTKWAQEPPKRMRNGWDTLKWMFYQYLIHFSSVLSDLGLVLKLAGTGMRTRTRTRAYPLSWPVQVRKPVAFTRPSSLTRIDHEGETGERVIILIKDAPYAHAWAVIPWQCFMTPTQVQRTGGPGMWCVAEGMQHTVP